jgi:hypothetical protein
VPTSAKRGTEVSVFRVEEWTARERRPRIWEWTAGTGAVRHPIAESSPYKNRRFQMVNMGQKRFFKRSRVENF